MLVKVTKVEVLNYYMVYKVTEYYYPDDSIFKAGEKFVSRTEFIGKWVARNISLEQDVENARQLLKVDLVFRNSDICLCLEEDSFPIDVEPIEYFTGGK